MANNNRKVECWFGQLLQRKGEDYIKTGQIKESDLSTNSIQRIITDIIQGNIDYNSYGYCITYPLIFDKIESYCKIRFGIVSAEHYALVNTRARISMGEISMGYGNYDTYDHVSSYMVTNIDAAIRETAIETHKFNILMNVFFELRNTGNVFTLNNVPNMLKQFVNSNRERI